MPFKDADSYSHECIDLIPTDQCIGARVGILMDTSIVGQITCVKTTIGARVYIVDWFVDGVFHSAEFYGFQLEVQDV